MLAETLDGSSIIGLSIAGTVLLLVFRTFWQQGDGWRAVLNAAREDAADARADAEHARTASAEAQTAASAAREDARLARDEARRAQEAEQRCLTRLASLERQLDEVRRHIVSGDQRLEQLENERPSGEIPVTDPASGGD